MYEAYNNMLANVFLTHTLTSGMEFKDIFFSFLKLDMLQVKITGMKQKTLAALFYTKEPLIGHNVTTFFSEKGHVAKRIKGT